jgi:hypothetical protein
MCCIRGFRHLTGENVPLTISLMSLSINDLMLHSHIAAGGLS